jgi:hypothetical protein
LKTIERWYLSLLLYGHKFNVARRKFLFLLFNIYFFIFKYLVIGHHHLLIFKLIFEIWINFIYIHLIIIKIWMIYFFVRICFAIWYLSNFLKIFRTKISWNFIRKQILSQVYRAKWPLINFFYFQISTIQKFLFFFFITPAPKAFLKLNCGILIWLLILMIILLCFHFIFLIIIKKF